MRNYVIVNQGTGDYYSYFFKEAQFTKQLIVAKDFDYPDEAQRCIDNYKLSNCVVATTSINIKNHEDNILHDKLPLPPENWSLYY